QIKTPAAEQWATDTEPNLGPPTAPPTQAPAQPRQAPAPPVETPSPPEAGARSTARTARVPRAAPSRQHHWVLVSFLVLCSLTTAIAVRYYLSLPSWDQASGPAPNPPGASVRPSEKGSPRETPQPEAVSQDPNVGEVHVFEGHTAMVEDIVFSPDGRRILSASQDNTLRLWDISSRP